MHDIRLRLNCVRECVCAFNTSTHVRRPNTFVCIYTHELRCPWRASPHQSVSPARRVHSNVAPSLVPPRPPISVFTARIYGRIRIGNNSRWEFMYLHEINMILPGCGGGMCVMNGTAPVVHVRAFGIRINISSVHWQRRAIRIDSVVLFISKYQVWQTKQDG